MTDTTQPVEERATELERRLEEIEANTRVRLIRAELKAEAVRAGMIDLDGLKLIDLSTVKLTEQGDVEGAADLMTQLRHAKPWLFGGASSSSTATVPPTRSPEGKPATKMNYEEWQAARAELLKRR